MLATAPHASACVREPFRTDYAVRPQARHPSTVPCPGVPRRARPPAAARRSGMKERWSGHAPSPDARANRRDETPRPISPSTRSCTDPGPARPSPATQVRGWSGPARPCRTCDRATPAPARVPSCRHRVEQPVPPSCGHVPFGLEQRRQPATPEVVDANMAPALVLVHGQCRVERCMAPRKTSRRACASSRAMLTPCPSCGLIAWAASPSSTERARNQRRCTVSRYRAAASPCKLASAAGPGIDPNAPCRRLVRDP
jgi:hypothetical protein